jgi:hypothetical protein
MQSIPDWKSAVLAGTLEEMQRMMVEAIAVKRQWRCQ